MSRRNQGRWIDLPKHSGPQALRLSDYLQQHPRIFKDHDLSAWLTAGYFKIEGVSAQDNHLIPPGVAPRLFQPPWDEPEVPTDFPVVYESPSLLVVDKPAGLPVTPSGSFYLNCLLHLLRAQTKNDELSPVHRLDIETSGLIAFAKQSTARGFYQTLFQKNRVDKTYVARVFGRFPDTLTSIDLPLGKDKTIYTKAIHIEDGVSARTDIVSVTYLAEHDHSMLVLKPITGRTNQLRAHCAAVGHPIVGDKKYGYKPELFLQWLTDKNTAAHLSDWCLPYQALHAQNLTLDTLEGTRPTLRATRDVTAEWARLAAAAPTKPTAM